MANFLKDKSVLVTGGTGSIGSALVQKLRQKNCKVIRVFSNDENGLYNLSETIKEDKDVSFQQKMKKNKIRFILGDVRELNRCLNATKNIDIVIHAAALKHVPICEFNPKEAYRTNFIGTKNLIAASKKNKVKKFLFISTDKVVKPISVMGKTKKIAESLVIKSNSKSNTNFSCIRFGNIIGSRGSVLPKFINQIKKNKNLSITDSKMERYFLTIDRAVSNIILSIDIMLGGEIFIIGDLPNFKILDLALVLKQYYEKQIGYRKKIIFTGIRSGERNYERLYSSDEHKNLFKYKNLIIINDNINIKDVKKKYKQNLKVQSTQYSKKIASKKFIKEYLIKNNLV